MANVKDTRGIGKLGSYCLLWITIVAALARTTSTQCTSLPNCASCTNPDVCDKCMSDAGEGTYGFRQDKAGCEDCYSNSAGTCCKCSSMAKCDQCCNLSQGPVAGTATAECGACAPNCRRCVSRGAGYCDDGFCEEGYATDSNSNMCSPCTAGCSYCAQSGPGGCDICPAGQGLPSQGGRPLQDCQACSISNCDRCHLDYTKCVGCKTGFELNASGSCIATKSTKYE